MRTCLLVLLVAACTETEPPGPNDPVSYRRHIQPIWDEWCVSCHSPASDRRLNTQLHAGASYASLMVGVGDSLCFRDEVIYGEPTISAVHLVEPYDPLASGLVLITGGLVTIEEAGIGCLASIMPRETAGLRSVSPAQWELVRRWVSEGARDN